MYRDKIILEMNKLIIKRNEAERVSGEIKNDIKTVKDDRKDLAEYKEFVEKGKGLNMLVGVSAMTILLSNIFIPLSIFTNILMGLTAGINVICIVKKMFETKIIKETMEISSSLLKTHKENLKIMENNIRYYSIRIDKLRNICENEKLTDEEMGKKFKKYLEEEKFAKKFAELLEKNNHFISQNMIPSVNDYAMFTGNDKTL